MKASLEAFEDYIARAQTRVRAAALFEAATLLFACSVAAFFFAAILVLIVDSPNARFFALGVSAALWAAGVFFIVRRVLPRFTDRYEVARSLEVAARSRGDELGDSVRSAQTLSTSHESSGQSRALVDAHIKSAFASLEKVDALRALTKMLTKRTLPLIIASFVFVGLFLSFQQFMPTSYEKAWARLLGQNESAQYAAVVRKPLVTDIDMTLRYPAHMAREDEEVLGASGDIVAPRGTVVILRGRSVRPVSAASLSLLGKDIAISVSEGRQLSTTFTVEEEGSYRFKLSFAEGDETLDPVAHKITIKRDQAPVVKRMEPLEDRVVQMDDEIVVRFSAEDDFGLAKVKLEVQRQQSGSPPYNKEVITFDANPKSYAGVTTFSVRETRARAGDRLTLTIIAEDNDTISGPNVGRSSPVVLTVFSQKEHHRRLIEAQERLLSQLVTVLADELEYDAPKSDDERTQLLAKFSARINIESRMSHALDTLAEIKELLKKDETTQKAVKRALLNMERELRGGFEDVTDLYAKSQKTLEANKSLLSFARTRLRVVRDRFVGRLETHILYLDDLINQERIAEVKSLADDMKRSQEELKTLIEQFKESGSEETRQALMDEIKRLREQLSEMMKRMGELQREIPDEYLNEEAFKSQEMMEQSKSLEELIQEGKLDEAAKQLDEMVKNTEKMLEQLDKTKEEFGGEEYEKLNEKIDEFAQELEAIENEQKELLERSERLLEAARQKAEDKMRTKLKAKMAELLKEAKRAREALEGAKTETMFQSEREEFDIAKARSKSTQEALEVGDIEDALEAVGEAASAARGAERAMRERTSGRYGSSSKALRDAKKRAEKARPALEEIEDALREMLPDPKKMLNEAQKQAMKKDGKRQQALAERTQKLVEKMREVNKEAPIFNPGHEQAMKDASGEMQRGGRELKREGLRKGRGHQAQAMQGLEGLKKSMQQAGKGEGSGMPMPFPSMGQGQGDQEGDGKRPKSDRVEIPKEDAYKVPDSFRKDILDAMREGAPGEWEKEVRRYYEGLVK